MPAPKKLQGPPVALIKTEPGTSRNPSLRLPSFKPPRDMMLGSLPSSQGTARKVYVPNLNVQRKKNQEETLVKSEIKESGRGKERGGRGRRSRGGRGRGGDLIQSGAGTLFSQGVAADTKKSQGSGSSADHSSGSYSSSKTRIKELKTLDPKENRERLSRLLQDDFVDNPDLTPDTADMPTQLPTLKVKLETQVKKGVIPAVRNGETNGEVKIKEELQENEISKPQPTNFENQENLTLPQLLNTTTSQLVLLKLPDGLFHNVSAEDDTSSRPSTSKSAEETAPPDSKVSSENCLLPEGRIGKLQLMKSGKVRLIIGNQTLNTTLAVGTTMRQNLISMDVDANTPGGDMINLGHINASLVSSPFFDSQSS